MCVTEVLCGLLLALYLVFSDFISDANVLFKRKRAGEGGLPRQGHGHFPSQSRIFHYEIEQGAGWVLRCTLEIPGETAQLGLSGTHGWVSGSLWPANGSHVSISQYATRDTGGGHIQHLPRDLGRSPFCTHMAAKGSLTRSWRPTVAMETQESQDTTSGLHIVGV